VPSVRCLIEEGRVVSSDVVPGDLRSRVIKSRRMRWARYIARMERGKVYTGFWWGNHTERDHWGDSGVDRRIILR
jgi:hypothetical protein